MITAVQQFLDVLARLALVFMFAALLACGSANKTSVPQHHEGKAQLSIFFKTESSFTGKGPYLFLDDKVLGRVPPRNTLTISTSSGSARLALNGLRSGHSFTEWQAKEITLEDNERLYLVYDQSTWVLFEVTEERFADFRAEYPAVVEEPSGTANNLTQAVVLPILLPGIVVFSLVTGQPVQ